MRKRRGEGTDEWQAAWLTRGRVGKMLRLENRDARDDAAGKKTRCISTNGGRYLARVVGPE